MIYNYGQKNTFSDELIAFIFSCRSTSIRRSILWERYKKRRDISYSVYTQNIYRLRKRGLITERNGLYKLSDKGISYRKNPYSLINEKFKSENKILMIFDIPENKKRTREWVRRQIKNWNFKMIQKSVWVGKGPLPEEFKKRLKILGVEEGVKIFKIKSK